MCKCYVPVGHLQEHFHSKSFQGHLVRHLVQTGASYHHYCYRYLIGVWPLAPRGGTEIWKGLTVSWFWPSAGGKSRSLGIMTWPKFSRKEMHQTDSQSMSRMVMLPGSWISMSSPWYPRSTLNLVSHQSYTMISILLYQSDLYRAPVSLITAHCTRKSGLWYCSRLLTVRYQLPSSIEQATGGRVPVTSYYICHVPGYQICH